MKATGVPEPPTGLARLLFRLPILLYRARLGWLLGGRFVLIEHIGRRTGRTHRTVVEIVDHIRADGSYLVASGFGARADWYRNLRAHPTAVIHVARRRLEVMAVPLPPADGRRVMASYATRHPLAARRLCRFMGYEVDGSEDDYAAVGERIPFMQLVPDGHR